MVEPRAMTQRDVRICFFGDSLTNGTLDHTYLSWPARLCASLPLQVTHYNLGIRGNTAVDILERWESEAQRRWKPGTEKRLVFSFGTNDCSLEGGRPRVSVADSVLAAEKILARASEVCPVLFTGPPAVELDDGPSSLDRLQELSQRYAELSERMKVPYFDLFAATHNSAAWPAAAAAGDGVYPDASGYALFAGVIGAWDAWRSWW